MHLKGEKELKAEKVYSLLEAEYSKEFDKYADKCKSLNIKDVENIMSENRRQLVMFNALQVIYNMELTDSEADTLLRLANGGQLLSTLAKVIITIDKTQIEHYIRNFIDFTGAMEIDTNN